MQSYGVVCGVWCVSFFFWSFLCVGVRIGSPKSDQWYGRALDALLRARSSMGTGVKNLDGVRAEGGVY